jgi:hypothetical protein
VTKKIGPSIKAPYGTESIHSWREFMNPIKKLDLSTASSPFKTYPFWLPIFGASHGECFRGRVAIRVLSCGPGSPKGKPNHLTNGFPACQGSESKVQCPRVIDTPHIRLLSPKFLVSFGSFCQCPDPELFMSLLLS